MTWSTSLMTHHWSAPRAHSGEPEALLGSEIMKDDLALRVHERLAAFPGLRPVAPGEGPGFRRRDLASVVEGALGACVDPHSLTASREQELRARLGEFGQARKDEDTDDEDMDRRRYWIYATGEPGPGIENKSEDRHEDGRGAGDDHSHRQEDRRDHRRDGAPGQGPVGTIAVDTWPTGAGALRIWSLYVHPVARRRGLASAVLDTVYEACRAEGLHGFRLDAYWTWQNSVRHYLNRGLWVTSWKHALVLSRLSYLPRYEVREYGRELAFLVTAGPATPASGSPEMMPLLVAGSEGGRLRLRETTEGCALMRDQRDAVRLYARSTLALHLAVRGRPLTRGEAEWAEADGWGDLGEPEGLAYKIGVFERVAREAGWRVNSPYANPMLFGAP